MRKHPVSAAGGALPGLPPSPAALRARMEEAIERLLAAMDALDAPEEDLEDGADSEPSYGATESFNQGAAWAPKHCIGVDEGEPSLGSLEWHPGRWGHGSQGKWSHGDRNDLEDSDVSHEGDELDTLEGDNTDNEPSLGSCNNFAQVSWAAGAADDCELDGPPTEVATIVRGNVVHLLAKTRGRR